MLGIAHCIHNRILAGWESGDWLKVIQNCPIHSANNAVEHDFQSLPDVWDQDFRWLTEKCEQLYAGCLQDEVTTSMDAAFYTPRRDALGRAAIPSEQKSGLYYCDLRNVTRDWFKDKILGHKDEHAVTSSDYPLTFYC